MVADRILVNQIGADVVVEGINCFDLEKTLDCGQAFRWHPLNDGRWQAVAYNRLITVGLNNGLFTLYNTNIEEFERIWREYFDLDRDYCDIISAISENPVLDEAGRYAFGLRLLKQEPWETLCSFIISQNNNIPRIKGIIDRLCSEFGIDLGEGNCSFPSAEVISKLTLEDLGPLRSGFRAKYILDAAKMVASGQVELDTLSYVPLEEAKESLMKIKGVGPKVADCALLFGLGRIECFPKDVWIKRAMAKLFDGELPECALPYAGIVQQYIFHYARTGYEFDD